MHILIAVVMVLAQGVMPPRVGGTVVDQTGAAIAGAVVRTAGIAVVTREDGSFEVAGAPPLTLVVSVPGFADATVSVTAASELPLRIVLVPRAIAESLTVSSDSSHLRISTPASATVLDAETLALMPSLALDDQLRTIPGFSLFRRSSSRVANPTTQGVTLRGLSASGASRTVVLADGIPLNDPFGGWVYWDRLPAAAIARVEVARGGAGDLYGSDALGGAIRIDTSSAGAAMIAEGGESGTGRLSLFGGRTFGLFDARAGAEYFTTDGFVTVAPESRGGIDTRADSRHTSAYGGVGASPGHDLRVDLRGGYFSETRGNGTPFQTNGTVIRHGSASVSGQAAHGIWSARAYAASQGYDQTFSAVAADRATERPTSAQHVDAASGGLWVEWLRPWPRGALLLAGSAKQVSATLADRTIAAVSTVATTDADQRTGAAIAQISIAASPRVSISAGTRAELWRARREPDAAHQTGYFVPRASLAFRVSPGLSLRTSLQSGFRTPTINELYRDFRVGNVLTTANAALRAERSTGIEGAALFTRGRGAARATLFWSTLDAAVVNVTLQSGSTIVRQRQNAGRIRARGIELESDLRVTNHLALTASAAFIDSTFIRGAGLDGLRVPQVPRTQASAGVRLLLPHVTGGLDWRFAGQQFDDDRNQFSLESASIVDGRVAWRASRRAEVFAAVENVFDVDQDVGRTPLRTVGMPRTMRMGLRVTIPR